MRKRYRTMILVLAAVTALFAAACGQQESEKKTEETGQSAEEKESVFGEFKTRTLNGDDADQEIFSQSKLTMVNVWATFCGPCINEMPDLGEISRAYDSSRFQIVGLISDVTEPEDESALEIVEATQADYTHLTASEDLMNGVLRKINVVPTTIFVDRDGIQVGGVYTGSKSQSSWEHIIEQNLQEVE